MGCSCGKCGSAGCENIVQIIGQKGDPGEPGATPTINAGSTTTLPPGDAAIVELVSEGNNAYHFDFSIPAGADGTNGTNGNNGWTPILAVITDGERRVLRIYDWTGGSGTKPSTVDQYIGATGIVNTAAAAVDIRGAAGVAATGGVPIGSSVEYGGTTDLAPDPDTGAYYFVEDGRSLLRSSYPTLFSRIGTRFGSVDSLHFNIPDSRNLTVFNLGSSTEFNLIGKKGGSKTATVLATNLPVLCPWPVVDPQHQHNERASTTAGGATVGLDSVPSRNGEGAMYLKTALASTGITMGSNTGGAQPISILPPYIVKNKIIRVL